MRTRVPVACVLWIVLFALSPPVAAPAAAQSGGWVGGDLFADLKSYSSSGTANPLNGHALGGGAEAGVFFAPAWSLALSVNFGATTTTSTPIPIGVLALAVGVTPPLTGFQSQVTNRILATSILVGYHVAVHHRVHLGANGGLSFLHVTRSYDTVPRLPLAATGALVGLPSAAPIGTVVGALVTRPQMLVDNVPAPTIGGELAIDVIRHVALVPELRAHAFSLSNGGPSGFAIRPGIGARWIF